ncbi:MAG: McrC family protein [Fibromonadaceae bacterium]|jgi:5-methylcytosine-specific restriction enzyme subunit McrC|nr:McrC family protein [Fibromonadaceae bacterium]
MNNTITVFEHQSLKIDDLKLRKALEIFRSDKKDFPYYSLIHNGVKFNSYVGVIQVGKTIIEILPKADKNNDENKWRNILIGMLRTVYDFDVKAPTQSSLKIKPNSILELYFEVFVKEVEYLLHTGLSKQYIKIENNLNSLKGKILFSKHIQKNLIHKKKFFVNYTTYDKEHILHKLLYKTLKLLQKINTNPALQSKICALLLNFPEMPDIKVTENTFNKITYSRKTEAYRNAINIAKLLLLNYHPDIRGGSNSVLAIMFDMNKLWEEFVYKSLRKHLGNKGYEVKEQVSKLFWESRKIKPDIVIKKDNEYWILDTKWKILDDNAKDINDNDLKQMFVYSLYFDAPKVALVYPTGRSYKNDSIKGGFEKIPNETNNRACDLIFIEVNKDIKVWQEKIASEIFSIFITNETNSQ